MTSPTPASDSPEAGILDLADAQVVRRNSQRTDEVGELIRHVQDAADPDQEFQRIARQCLAARSRAERRLLIAKFSAAFGVETSVMKGYLKAKAITNQAD